MAEPEVATATCGKPLEKLPQSFVSAFIRPKSTVYFNSHQYLAPLQTQTKFTSGTPLMLDHMTFRVTNIARAKAFYSAALAPLGYSLSFEGNFGMNILGFAYPDASEPDGKKADVWFIDGPSAYGGPPATTGCHLAWRAETRAQVDAFYREAIAAGGKNNGAPGLRPEYHAHYYGAFVIDPEGNNIEAVCHQPA